MKKITKNRIKRIVPDTSLIGSKKCYLVRYDYEDIYFVSPAIYELLHDEDCKTEIMKSIKIVEVDQLIKEVVEEYINNLMMNDDTI